jgi:hypothetical protein
MKKKNFSIFYFSIILYALLLISSIMAWDECDPSSWFEFYEENNITYEKGIYINPNYLFLIKIPNNVIAFRNAAPAPNHGIEAFISKKDIRYLFFYSRYNSDLWEKEEEGLDRDIEWLKEDKNKKLIKYHRLPSNLGKQPAMKQIIYYICKYKPEEIRIEITILSLRPPYKGIIDTAVLLTNYDNLFADYKIFMSIINTWETIEKKKISNKE